MYRFLGPPTPVLPLVLLLILPFVTARPSAFVPSSSVRRLDHFRIRRAAGSGSCGSPPAVCGQNEPTHARLPAAANLPVLCAKQGPTADDGPPGGDELSGGDEEGGGGDNDEFRQLKIAFVTGNAMKAREVELILAEYGATRGPAPDYPSLVDLRMLNVDLPEIQEINTEAIAKNKAIQAAQLAGGPCVVEDTSLKFSALGGMPGPFIKWFQEKLKSEGLYKILTDYEDKTATAVCTLAFCPAPHADPVVFTGKTRGTIVAPVEGRGFGWDSIFVPEGEEIPFSCMSTEQKCSLSHRGKAVQQWADWLGVNKGALWDRQEGRQEIGHKGLNFKSVFAEQ